MANPNQMPVRYVRVEAGDGSEGYQPGAGSYPNHRGKVGSDLHEACAENAASAAHFGVSPDACAKRDFRYRHFYNCPSGSENVLDSCPGGANPSDTRYESLLNNEGCWDPTVTACVFRPRVQVQDNWGYCTNAVGKTCTTGLGGDSCYDDTGGQDATNECDEPESWVPFAGRIVVTPP